jgi:hypothetical protein
MPWIPRDRVSSSARLLMRFEYSSSFSRLLVALASLDAVSRASATV